MVEFLPSIPRMVRVPLHRLLSISYQSIMQTLVRHICTWGLWRSDVEGELGHLDLETTRRFLYLQTLHIETIFSIDGFFKINLSNHVHLFLIIYVSHLFISQFMCRHNFLSKSFPSLYINYGVILSFSLVDTLINEHRNCQVFRLRLPIQRQILTIHS